MKISNSIVEGMFI